MKKLLALAVAAAFAVPAQASPVRQTKGDFEDKFRQLSDEVWRSPNVYRDASGAPGPNYWQQKADYLISVKLDEKRRRIIGSESITYTNNSPMTLRYVWVQLDQNRFKDGSTARVTETASTMGSRRHARGEGDSLSFAQLRREQEFADVEYGFEIKSVTEGGDVDLPYVINDTMMRIDLERPLAPGRTMTIGIAWEHNIIHESVVGGRGGYEHFPETDTYQYALAQWYPRVAAFTDYGGWNHKQFLGRGEFTLEFGDYEVAIEAPADHIVASTGELQNPTRVLSAEQRARLAQAARSDKPVFIVTPDEAMANEGAKDDGTKTWRFEAENVRDFAWASSRKYIWDAMTFEQTDPDAEYESVLVMSYYPNEAEPIWSQYSSHAVAHTMDVYGRFSFPYPYPVAISVNAWKSDGMEYPMMTFNGYRPVVDEKTGERTYSRRTRYGLISVIIHEIGHIFFPMTVNSDERQWTWMDEGLNTFLQFLAEREWEDGYPSRRGDPESITDYMISQNQVPIMTQSDSVLNLGPNAYGKPATALVILRETVMGRELFDHAFKEFSRRWMFKRPTPEDFFRTMEDASGVDLDWFWRGWFYSTDHVDIAVTDVRSYDISSQNPEIEFARDRSEDAERPVSLTQRRNAELPKYVDDRPELLDFYNENDPFTVTNKDRNTYNAFRKGLSDWEARVLDRALEEGQMAHFLDFENQGGLVMPLPLRVTYEDETVEDMLIPAEIWRRQAHHVTKVLIRPKAIAKIELDPELRIADVDMADNTFPPQIRPSRLDLFKSDRQRRNMMADMLEELKTDENPESPDGEGSDAPLQPGDGSGG